MANWRARLIELMEAEGLTRKALSAEAGLDPSMVSKILNNPEKEPSIATMQALAKRLRVSTSDLLGELEEIGPVKPIRIAGDVAAGLWIEADTFVDVPPHEPIPRMPDYLGLEQIAYRVRGNSVDLLQIHDGDFVITVPYFQVRVTIQDGDVVVVERRHGHLIERTCKQVQVKPRHYELWPRSSDPRFKEPLIIPRERRTMDTEEVVEVVGLVIGTFRPARWLRR